MKTLLRLILGIAFIASTSFGQHSKSSARTIPEYSIEGSQVHSIPSRINGTTYKLHVQLPASYHDSTSKKYPTVFMLDADNVFGMAVDIAAFLQMGDEIPEVILVGIGYGAGIGQPGNKRYQDYLPTVISERKGSGGGMAFMNVISDEIIPFVDKRFRTDDSNRTLWGGSAGGLLAFTVLFHKPELFQTYIINSPPFYSDTILFAYERSFAASHSDLRATIFTCVGSLEKEDIFVAPWKRLTETLLQRKYKSLRIKSVVLDGEVHVSGVGRAFSNGLRFVFETD